MASMATQTELRPGDGWRFMPCSLEEYDVNLYNGFLPREQPLLRLTNSYYSPWENMTDNFRKYMVAGIFRQKIRELPVLSTEHLQDMREYRRACVILSFLSHSYIWGHNEVPETTLPKQLSIPWCTISNKLGIVPILTNTTSVLWNWEFLNDGCSDFASSNLYTSVTFTGTTDESWFFTVSTMIEAKGGDILHYGGIVLDAVHSDSIQQAIYGLDGMTDTIKQMITIIKRMPESNDPYLFYWKLRKYFAGWENMEEAGIEHGVIYEDADAIDYNGNSYPKNSFIKFKGASAAQSSVIQVLDILLGIKHFNTEENSASSEANNQCNSVNKHLNKAPGSPYLLEMRKYMTRTHRQFLVDLEKICGIRSYVIKKAAEIINSGDTFSELLEINDDYLSETDSQDGYSLEQRKSLLRSYNRCVSTLKAFRDAHIEVVKVYVVSQARSSRPHNPKTAEAPSRQPRSATAAINIPENRASESDTLMNSPTLTDNERLGEKRSIGNANELAKKLQSISVQETRGPSPANKSGLAMERAEGQAILGTGGTDAISFLKNLRDETRSSRIV
ncbi:hypothetical protein BB560_002706 [Smittium megazygosporum]|uniref:Indoleamine 2,3-dioxygenase n=1 Tax=Smittium megazygosporum TaxID=133381 RepID=A0A2T9ZE04_9FUNG|nr:hypothetical protein BB560_002706 [Smittium megazygosporum]